MGLSVKNEEVERLARQIAAQEGISITEAIRRGLMALKDRPKEKWSPEDITKKMKNLENIQTRVAKKWVDDGQTLDEILGYDSRGLA